jgi:hypothetical protein
MSEHVKAALIWVLFHYLGYHKKFMGKLLPRPSYVLKMREMVERNRTLYLKQQFHQKNLKGVYHMAIKVYNGLPYELKEISSYPKKVKANLKDFLYTNSFYALEEFFNR